VTERFDIQLGGRESHIDQDDEQAIETGALVGSATNPQEKSTANAFTYLVTPQFKFSSDLMVYARLASGYRPGAPNSFNSDPAVPRKYAPDKTENYELGAKGNLMGTALTFDASIYYIDWKDLQLNLLDPINGLTYGTNGSRAKSEGLELSLGSTPMRGLKLAAWMAWNEAVLTENFPAGSAVHGATGDRLPFSSRFSGNLSADQEFPFIAGATAFVGASVSYTGARVGTFLATADRYVYPAFAKIDLRMGVKYDSWRASLYANNVANRFALLGGGPGNFPPYGFTILQPRLIGVSISRQF